MTVLQQFIQRDPATGTGTITFSGVAATLIHGGVKYASSHNGEFLNVPQGAGYVEHVWEANGSTVVYHLAIGALIGFQGQSDVSNWFGGTPLVASSADTFLFRSDGTWGSVKGAGAVEFANDMTADLGCPVALADFAKGHTALLEEDVATAHSYSWWLDGPMYQNAVSLEQYTGTHFEDMVIDVGDDDAIAHNVGNDLQNGFFQFFADVERDFGAPQIFIQEPDTLSNWHHDETYFAALGTMEQYVTTQLSYAHIGGNASGSPLENGGPHYIPIVYETTLPDMMAASIWQYDQAALL